MTGAQDEWRPSTKDWDACFIAVGRFMFSWAALENEVNRFVTAAMGLGSTEGIIVCSNLQFRDKMHIVTTALNEFGPNNKEWTVKSKEIAKEIRALNVVRNIVAHQFFSPDQRGGIQFYIRKAKGKLNLDGTVWSASEFADFSLRIYAAAHEIEALCARIKARLTRRSLASGLLGAARAYYEEDEDTGALSRRSRAQPQAQAPQGDPAPNPQSGDETQPGIWDGIEDTLSGRQEDKE